MLNLLYGSSGTGKTNTLIQSIRADVLSQKRCYLLVPEQQAYISERDLPRQLPSNAGLYFKIVHFSGLAEDVFREYGGIARHSLEKGDSAVLMWETLRQLAPSLMQYGNVSTTDTTLTAEMLSVMEEFRNNGIDSNTLEEAVKKLPDADPLKKKLSDLVMILTAFNERLFARLGEDATDRLQAAAELLKEHRYFASSHIYVDSFTGFTAPEYSLLQAILKQADAVTVSLCTDHINSHLMHFEGVTQTAKRLIDLAKIANSEIKLCRPTTAPAEKAPQLRILERDLWNFNLTREKREIPAENAPVSIRRIVCPNAYEEAEACALNILGLVQNGMHYGDIAVVVRDTDTYRGILDAALERHGIPCFFSERTALSTKPLSRLILSALRAVSHHYRTQDVLTLVKTGLCGGDFRDVSLFEEYCETWHISGNRFLDQVWSMNPDGLTEIRTKRGEEILEAANRVKDAVMKPLLHLSVALRASNRLTDRCRAVYGYLEELKIAQKLSDHAKKELALGQKREAGETVRLYQFVIDTLTGLCRLLPDTELSVPEFLTLLTLHFSLTDLGSVPTVQDCVVVGSADTLRVEDIRASFLLGLCEGEFPLAITDKGLLTEKDKETLRELEITLDSAQKLRYAEELFYVYRAMTKPREQLILSYPAKQSDGSVRTPSQAYSRVGFLFDDKAEDFDSAIITGNNAENAKKIRLEHQAKASDGKTVLRLSQSSIQAFVGCPYRYYSTYQLNIRSKKDSTVNASDEGNFLHFVFEQFLKKSLNESGALALPSSDAVPTIADEIISEYIEKVCPIPQEMMDNRLLHLFGRLRVLALLILQDIVCEIRIGKFIPVGFEQRLGGRTENALPPVRFELSDGSFAEVRGTVDRIDVYEENGKLYIRIVDYKTGEHKFSFDKVRSGEDLQLVLYLFAVVSSDPDRYVPCGAQFLYSKTEKGELKIGRSGFLLDGDSLTQAADGSESGVYSKGLSRRTAEELEELTREMQETVRSVAERILSGEADKTPSKDACRFCPVIDHCNVACRDKK